MPDREHKENYALKVTAFRGSQILHPVQSCKSPLKAVIIILIANVTSVKTVIWTSQIIACSTMLAAFATSEKSCKYGSKVGNYDNYSFSTILTASTAILAAFR